MRFEEWYLPTADGACRLYVCEGGDGAPGPPVVLLHGGFGHDHEYLRRPFRFLADSRRLVLYDQRGSLRSPAKPETINVAAHVADLDLLRRELGVEQVTLVGHSMGTHLAMRYLATYPEAVREVVLIAATAPAHSPPPPVVETFTVDDRREARAVSKNAKVEEVIRSEGLDRPGLGARDMTRRWRIHFAGANIFHVERWRELEGGQIHYNEAADAAASPTDSFDFTAALAAHPHRITVIAGDDDFLDPGADWHQKWFGSISGVEVLVIPDAGHNIWVDQPEAFRKAVSRALPGST